MAGTIRIGNHTIGEDSHCYVIAEIGHNHQGSIHKARELFKEAKLAGAHAVKLQKRNNRGLYTRAAYNKPYDNENSFGATYGEHREFLEFGAKEYRELQAYAKELDIDFFATAFDLESADFLESLNVPAYKLASGDLKSEPLLKHVARFGKPMIVSTGGAEIDDVQRAYDAIMPINPQLAILQCTAGYPAAFEELDLRVISTFRERFPRAGVRLHPHSARGAGLANVLAALEVGVDRFDASVGGIGGCPFAPGAPGNICSEDLIHMLHEMGIATGVDLPGLLDCARMLEDLLGHELPGQTLKAGLCKHLPAGGGPRE